MSADSGDPDLELDAVRRIFSRVLKAPALSVRYEDELGRLPGWDSINHIGLIVEIERELGTRLKLSEIRNLTSVRLIVDLLKAKRIRP